MLRFLKTFFGKKNEPAEQAPYKIEQPSTPLAVEVPVIDMPVPAFDVAPQPIKCGCGRSASGYCVGLHKLTQEEWAVHPENPKKVTPPAAKAPAKKAPAKKKSATAKPAAITASKKRTSKKTPG